MGFSLSAAIERATGNAYAKYDSDPRVNGPYDYDAFRDAVDMAVRLVGAEWALSDFTPGGHENEHSNGSGWHGRGYVKRIATWKWGNNPTRDEFTTTRVYLIAKESSRCLPFFDEMAAILYRDFPGIEHIERSTVKNDGPMKGCLVVTGLLPNGTKHPDYEQNDIADIRY